MALAVHSFSDFADPQNCQRACQNTKDNYPNEQLYTSHLLGSNSRSRHSGQTMRRGSILTPWEYNDILKGNGTRSMETQKPMQAGSFVRIPWSRKATTPFSFDWIFRALQLYSRLSDKCHFPDNMRRQKQR